jgi:hypothetical protein
LAADEPPFLQFQDHLTDSRWRGTEESLEVDFSWRFSEYHDVVVGEWQVLALRVCEFSWRVRLLCANPSFGKSFMDFRDGFGAGDKAFP